MEDLSGNNLQMFISKEIAELKHLWPEDVRAAVKTLHCEVADHNRGVVTSARVGNSYVLWPSPSSSHLGYQRIEDGTPDGIRTMLREHLEHMVDPIRDAIQRASR